MIVFGDIFAFDENKYVYLTESDGILYAAKIIPPGTADEIERLMLANAANPTRIYKNQNIAYCFVRLTTDGYDRHGAHLGKTNDPTVASAYNKVSQLNDADRTSLINEILNGDAAKGIPNEVKDAVRELEA